MMVASSVRRLAALGLGTVAVAACATHTDIERLESKIDQIAIQTDRGTLTELFGAQAGEMGERLRQLGADERVRYEDLVGHYERGETTLEDVRDQIATLVGGGRREVSTASGIWVRDLEGERVGPALPRGARIQEAVLLAEAELPERVRTARGLSRYQWGRGTVDGRTVIFPWDYTLSPLTKEIVENTARRTVQELVSLGGLKTVRVQVVTDRPEDVAIETSDGGGDVVVAVPRTAVPAGAPAAAPPPAPQSGAALPLPPKSSARATAPAAAVP